MLLRLPKKKQYSIFIGRVHEITVNLKINNCNALNILTFDK